MNKNSRALKAGITGMVGAFLFMASVIMQYSLGLFGPEAGWLWVLHQLLVFTALICIMIGFLGIIWGGGVQSLFGKISVYTFIAGWALVVAAGASGLFLGSEDSPIFILYPVGGTLSEIGALLTGITVLAAGLWAGWQRFMPLINFLVVFFGVSLPSYLNASDGPGLVGELVMGICWFGVALAVYTTQTREVSVQTDAVG